MEISIDDRIVYFLSNLFKGKQVIPGFLLAFLIGSAIVYAMTPLNIPNSFQT